MIHNIRSHRPYVRTTHITSTSGNIMSHYGITFCTVQNDALQCTASAATGPQGTHVNGLCMQPSLVEPQCTETADAPQCKAAAATGPQKKLMSMVHVCNLYQ
eukprot:1162000-Pelagomonas_calceolata.AAC.6